MSEPLTKEEYDTLISLQEKRKLWLNSQAPLGITLRARSDIDSAKHERDVVLYPYSGQPMSGDEKADHHIECSIYDGGECDC
jgi:hypothetical protein